MIAETDTLSIIAQKLAARDAEAGDYNAERLAEWQRRYPHDVVSVPAPVKFDGWPPTRRTAEGFELKPLPEIVLRLPVRGRG